MSILMYLVCALVLLSIAYFLVLFTGEITRWLSYKLGDSYRNNKQQVTETVRFRTTVAPKA